MQGPVGSTGFGQGADWAHKVSPPSPSGAHWIQLCTPFKFSGTLPQFSGHTPQNLRTHLQNLVGSFLNLAFTFLKISGHTFPN